MNTIIPSDYIAIDKEALDEALKHFDYKVTSWANCDCFQVRHSQETFAIDARGELKGNPKFFKPCAPSV